MPKRNEHQHVWRIGELAERTGLTVRTLHHYDALGLLSPSARTESAHGSGHRLYVAEDVARLQQIVSLKQLGFGLDQIREYLARSDYDPREVVRLQLNQIRNRTEELRRLEWRLTALAEALDRSETVGPDDFLNTIQEMTMIEKYYTPEQLQQLAERKDAVGEERIQQVQQEWADLQAAVQSAMDAGTAPVDPQAQALARRWFGLVREFTGGDPGIFQSLNKMYQNEDRIHGMDVAAMRPMVDYVGKAAKAAGIQMPGQ